MRTAILGAGYMGSAIAFPLSDNGVHVNLWGTWLDDDLIAGARDGCHPRLNKAMPENVHLYESEQLAEALKDADFIIVAVTSEGFVPVFEKMLEALEQPVPLLTVTKGFVSIDDTIHTISGGADVMFRRKFGDDIPGWVSIGGPVKAVELSNKIPSATIFGYRGDNMPPLFDHFASPYYRIYSVPDVTGTEICSAFKNIYAIVMGICDGLYKGTDASLFHNFKALLFNHAIREIAFLADSEGGQRDTAFHLAGVGDFYVTSASGRNGALGRLIGAGQPPESAYRQMLDAEEIPEGYHTMQLGKPYLETGDAERIKSLPLFNCLYRIMFEQAEARKELFAFASSWDTLGLP